MHESLQSVNLSEGQTMNVYRYANRAPLQFQPGACLITQTAKHKTSIADVVLGEDGKPIEEEDFGENVIVVA